MPKPPATAEKACLPTTRTTLLRLYNRALGVPSITCHRHHRLIFPLHARVPRGSKSSSSSYRFQIFSLSLARSRTSPKLISVSSISSIVSAARRLIYIKAAGLCVYKKRERERERERERDREKEQPSFLAPRSRDITRPGKCTKEQITRAYTQLY